MKKQFHWIKIAEKVPIGSKFFTGSQGKRGSGSDFVDFDTPPSNYGWLVFYWSWYPLFDGKGKTKDRSPKKTKRMICQYHDPQKIYAQPCGKQHGTTLFGLVGTHDFTQRFVCGTLPKQSARGLRATPNRMHRFRIHSNGGRLEPSKPQFRMDM